MFNKDELKSIISENYKRLYGMDMSEGNINHMYGAFSYTVREILNEKRADFFRASRLRKRNPN